MNYKLIALVLGVFFLGFLLGKAKFSFRINSTCPAVRQGRQILAKLDQSDNDYLE